MTQTGTQTAQMNVATTRQTDCAHNVFSQWELFARIAVYEDRVMSRLELFADMEAEDEQQGKCWGCGAVPPLRTWVERIEGWHTRSVHLYGSFTPREICCPDCWAELGEEWY